MKPRKVRRNFYPTFRQYCYFKPNFEIIDISWNRVIYDFTLSFLEISSLLTFLIFIIIFEPPFVFPNTVAASIVHNPNSLNQPPVNVIKIENPGYYCSSYTPPAPDHTAMMTSGSYSEYSTPNHDMIFMNIVI